MVVNIHGQTFEEKEKWVFTCRYQILFHPDSKGEIIYSLLTTVLGTKTTEHNINIDFLYLNLGYNFFLNFPSICACKWNVGLWTPTWSADSEKVAISVINL